MPLDSFKKIRAVEINVRYIFNNQVSDQLKFIKFEKLFIRQIAIKIIEKGCISFFYLSPFKNLHFICAIKVDIWFFFLSYT